MLKIAIGLLFSGLTTLSATGSKLSAKDVNAVLSKYRAAGAFRSKVKKTVVQEVLGTENSGNGRFYFSKGKIRLEMAEPENTILVYDGSTVWMETRLDAKTIEVTKVKSRDLKKNDSLLAALFDRKDILNSFTLSASGQKEGMKLYTFTPRNKKKTEIRQLEIGLNGAELGRISYTDDRENRVTFDFSDIQREAVPGEKFAYKPPAGAVVTEM